MSGVADAARAQPKITPLESTTSDAIIALRPAPRTQDFTTQVLGIKLFPLRLICRPPFMPLYQEYACLLDKLVLVQSIEYSKFRPRGAWFAFTSGGTVIGP